MRDHSADAGGDAEILEAKRALREEVWTALRDGGVARFPGAHGRIPNFAGAEQAAERLRDTPAWRVARVIKANPNAPQWPVRQRALEDGITVCMAVPRLAEPEPFLLLEPAELSVPARQASSIKGASTHARPAAIDDVEPFDMVVLGCVAVDREGVRLGKGGGFADLEFALATAAGLIDADTTVVTTVHPLQVVDRGRIPRAGHDAPLDLIVTPDGAITCEGGPPRPAGIDWQELTPEKIASIPVLADLKPADA